jgi:hypothetical protein
MKIRSQKDSPDILQNKRFLSQGLTRSEYDMGCIAWKVTCASCERVGNRTHSQRLAGAEALQGSRYAQPAQAQQPSARRSVPTIFVCCALPELPAKSAQGTESLECGHGHGHVVFILATHPKGK